MLSEQDLSDYAERSSKLIDESPQMNEQNTRRKIIEPLIDLLGWEILSSEVELEYSVRMGSGTRHADYALILEETPVVFIEAKGCDTNIERGKIDQLTSYMRQVGVEWGLLSNGKKFEIYKRNIESTRPNETSLGRFTIDEVWRNKEILSAISKRAIEKGESRQIADKIESRQKATNHLQEHKEDIANQIVQMVTKQVGESISQNVENEAKNFVDNLTASLEDEKKKNRSIFGSQTSNRDIDDQYSIEVLENNTAVKFVSGTNQAESMAHLVNYLIDTHGLLYEISIPYIPGRGTGNRNLINTSPKHSNGDDMKLSKKLNNGYYLFTSLDANSKIRYMRELADIVDLECDFSPKWN